MTRQVPHGPFGPEKHKLIGGVALGVAILGAAFAATRPDTEARAVEHLANQVWIERLPASPRDIIGHIVFLDRDDGKVGAIGRSSRFRFFAELFGWRNEQDRLTLFFPQERKRVALGARTWKCKGEAPAPFELCLELTTPRRGTLKYYSVEDWVVDPNAVADSLAELGANTPELDGFVTSIDARVPDPSGEWNDDSTLPLVP